jgi:DNA-binding transcriptional LysR family regulator
MEKGLVQDAIPDLPGETQGIYAMYPPGRFTQPKVRAFVDFLTHTFAHKGPMKW